MRLHYHCSKLTTYLFFPLSTILVFNEAQLLSYKEGLGLIKSIDKLFRFVHKKKRKLLANSNHSSLPEEIYQLREELRDGERRREDLIREQSPGVERRMEMWRKEVGRELSSLRGHITRATSLGNLEERCITTGASDCFS